MKLFLSMKSIGIAVLLLLLPDARAEPTFNVFIKDNAEHDFSSRGWTSPDSPFIQNFQAAVSIWRAHLRKSTGVVNILLEADNSVSRTGGNYIPVEFGTDTNDGLMRMGSKAARNLAENIGPHDDMDMIVVINSRFVEKYYWFDSTPSNRNDEQVPDGKTDFVSIILHEIGHSMGFVSWRERNGSDIGKNSGKDVTFFDSYTYPRVAADDAGKPLPLFFSGPLARAANGGRDVPIAAQPIGSRNDSQNYDHIACDNPVLTSTLMNGCQVPVGKASRLTLTPIDIAMYQDLGLPIE